jgi:hypothetical protein
VASSFHRKWTTPRGSARRSRSFRNGDEANAVFVYNLERTSPNR